MEIKVVREQYRPGSTIGRLFLDGVFECYTLEDGIRTNKVYGETAIPAGAYEVTVDYSDHFGMELPHVLDVPKFEGIRIHPGNVPADTLGCILVGRNWQPGDEKISASRLAFAPLLSTIANAVKRGERVLLRVIQESAPPELAARAVKRASKPAARVKAGSMRRPGKTTSPKRGAKRTKSTKKTPARKT
jgi:hypothetical protein